MERWKDGRREERENEGRRKECECVEMDSEERVNGETEKMVNGESISMTSRGRTTLR